VYTVVVDRPRELRPRHSVENQWDLLRAIDPAFHRAPGRATDPVEMRVDPAASARVSARLGGSGVSTPEELIVVHVSAGNPFRRWPETAFLDVVTGLVAPDGSRRIILTAGPSDREATARVAAAARRRLGPCGAKAVLEFDDLSLAELHALIARATLFVGGDSGPLHVAATTEAPVIGIFGPTLSARSAPWRDPRWLTVSLEAGDLGCRPCAQRTCVTHDFRCLAAVTPTHVLDAAERTLGHAALEPPR
jgi:ADP-heptose:LPS heptosyltransferase